MTNNNIRDLMCAQFRWDIRDVKVEFIVAVGNVYEFVVTHDPEYSGKYAKKVVKISVEDI